MIKYRQFGITFPETDLIVRNATFENTAVLSSGTIHMDKHKCEIRRVGMWDNGTLFENIMRKTRVIMSYIGLL